MGKRAKVPLTAGVLLLTSLLYLLTGCVLFGIRVSRGMRLAEESSPLSVYSPLARHTVLVVGDSTGVGTGALQPTLSIAGLIARDHACVSIENIADDGALINDVSAQLSTIRRNDFHLVLVHAGGNDILRFTTLDEIRQSAEEMLKKAQMKSGSIIFVSTGNVGNAPAFFWPLNVIYTERTRKVRSIFHDVSRRLGVYYVDLFQERQEDAFLKDKDRYFAHDYLHPSAQGYALWYEEIRRQTPLDEILSCPGPEPDEPGKD
ncbi:MAG: GDSL-type esterase/lipase family protein [Desulfobacterota bacterium]|nr:GDSL-type esterase/lipase family protein [Thermodesulfobacteriota bacterium]